MDMHWFRIPRDIVYGFGTLGYLREIPVKRAVIVTGGRSMRKHGFIDRASEHLRAAGAEVRVIEGIEPDPTVDTVERGAREMGEFGPDLIVAIGGGSAIDAAKAMWVFYEHPDAKFEEIIKPFEIPELRKKARFVAVPSTSGTASEVTCASVITDPRSRVKYPLLSYEITPDIAIIDPELPLTMPPSVTADTGMDALTHAIEAFTSTKRSHFTDPLALEAIRLVFRYLPAAFRDGSDREAREKLHYAQALAGLAFTNAFLGIVHSMAHSIGAQFGIPHGRANAILLPFVMAYNASDAAPLYARIAESLGLDDEGDSTLRLIEAIRELQRTVGIPTTLREAGISEEEFRARIDDIARNAYADPCTGANPRHTSPSDIRWVYERAYYGSDATDDRLDDSAGAVLPTGDRVQDEFFEQRIDHGTPSSGPVDEPREPGNPIDWFWLR